jgi:hypothetical protein
MEKVYAKEGLPGGVVYPSLQLEEARQPAPTAGNGSSRHEKVARVLSGPLPAPEEEGANGELFLVERLDFGDQRVDFFGGQFAGELGHVAFAVGDDVAQVFRGGGRGFLGDKRWPAKMAAFGGFSMTLRAIFQIDRVREQARVPGRILGEGCG